MNSISRRLVWSTLHSRTTNESRSVGSSLCRRYLASTSTERTASGGTDSVDASSSAAAASDGANKTGKTKILYDGDCPLCIQEIKFVRYLNREKDVLHFVDISKPGYNQQEHNNIPLDEAMGIMHVIGPDNVIHTRIDAVDAMYRALGWGWMTGFMKWPVFSGIFDRGYMWFARNRLRLTGRQCEEANCKVPDR
ncbi:uncharacterized protein [Diadema antillarum]|uniref:uncharacterized protein n=1 Tax=Diadema antillarum TaxID=105358 RepID=UPI003A882E24